MGVVERASSPRQSLVDTSVVGVVWLLQLKLADIVRLFANGAVLPLVLHPLCRGGVLVYFKDLALVLV